MGVLKNDVGRPTNKTIMIRNILKTIGIIIAVGAIVISGYFLTDYQKAKDKVKNNTNQTTKKNDKKDEVTDEISVTPSVVRKEYKIESNGLDDFDLYFLKKENEEKNKVYSPLSIKYALEMLSEGAVGETKTQIDSVIGKYKAKKYTNSKNMSFANAFFIKDSFKKDVKSEYVNTLKSKYNAEVVYDSFKSPNTINNWISNKTFNMINNMFDDVSDFDFSLVNALAIDMEWNKRIKPKDDYYEYYFKHISCVENSEYCGDSVEPITAGYERLEFNNKSSKVTALDIAAVINKYDIIRDKGEANIRKTVTDTYAKWLESSDGKVDGIYYGDKCGDTYPEKYDIDTYMKELTSSYKHVSSSTDFLLHEDEKVKVFAKDLKTYNGVTLQYVGIMPKNDKLVDYVNNVTKDDLNKITSSLKQIKFDDFEDGYITKINGIIPVFNYDYELKLADDLKYIGITNAFDMDKANLSNLYNKSSVSENVFVKDAKHKTKIEFSNDGIKAAATTALGGGRGDGACGFDYIFDVPVKTIDLTFDKPYMYLIRDKVSGEVWFAGTVYEPTPYKEQY